MADFKLIETENNNYDIDFGLYDYKLDDGLQTAILISLFSDRRTSKAELPYGNIDQQGWWADTFEDYRLGSKLWLLEQAKHSEETRRRAKEYTVEALSWLVSENVAKSIEIETSWRSPGILEIAIFIKKASGEEVNYKFEANWTAELGE